ncbi:MAG TPA: hypothetical protein PLO29_05430 [Paludibacter sp.]|nr:MAG: hypothetical protein BWY08_00744 [Bacteroidetes bacterium ADurb.Bin174]HQB28372.1 hypothetical protein [Paludibacter sp.]
MKHLIPLYCLMSLLIMQSCERKIRTEYEYETNPVFTWGQAYFWGDCYANYNIENHVLSLYAFTDSLQLNDKGQLTGFGQYLYLDDIFVSPADTIFPEGTYTVSASREVMTIEPGSLFKEDRVEMDRGACIYFIEKVEQLTIRKFIKEGSMTVSYTDRETIHFKFDFILDDDTELNGYFETEKLIIYDDSVSKESVSSQKMNLFYKRTHQSL